MKREPLYHGEEVTSWNSGQILGVIYYLVVKTKLYTFWNVNCPLGKGRTAGMG